MKDIINELEQAVKHIYEAKMAAYKKDFIDMDLDHKLTEIICGISDCADLINENKDYADAYTANEVFSKLKLTRQQLHYYVSTGKIKKVFNKKGQFRYNRTDVDKLNIKLKDKYLSKLGVYYEEKIN